MFAVFGMSPFAAEKQVRKAFLKVTKVDKDQEEEWVKTQVDIMMASKRVIQLCPEFGSLTLAEEYKLLTENIGGIRLEIKAHAKIERTQTNASMKPYVLRWISLSEFNKQQLKKVEKV